MCTTSQGCAGGTEVPLALLSLQANVGTKGLAKSTVGDDEPCRTAYTRAGWGRMPKLPVVTTPNVTEENGTEGKGEDE